MVSCPWCFAFPIGLVFVAGHYQCDKCKKVVIECCDGEVVGRSI